MGKIDWKYLRYRFYDKMAEIMHRNKSTSSKATHARYSRLEFLDRFMVGRRWLNDNAIIGTVVMAMLMLLSMGFVVVQLIPTNLVNLKCENAWYYDQNTRERFIDKFDLVTPFDTGSGPAADGDLSGVRAHVYSYERANPESSCFIAFLEKLSPDADLNQKEEGYKAWAKTHLIRRVKDKKWVPANSKQGQKIIDSLTIPNMIGNTPHNVPAEELPEAGN
jgi:hypothetical protein